MRRISAQTPGEPEDGEAPRGLEESVDDLHDALRVLGSESPEFRRRLDACH